MSKNEMLKIKRGTSYKDIKEKILQYIEPDEKYWDSYLGDVVDSLPLLENDLSKVEFNFENSTVDSVEEGGGRKISFEPGTEAVWADGNGDWEIPVRFILYIDPQGNLRGYIPENGNTYCHECNCAYGNEGCPKCEEDALPDEWWDTLYDPQWKEMEKEIQAYFEVVD